MQRQRWPGIRRRATPMQRRCQVPVSRADGRPDLASSTSSSLSKATARYSGRYLLRTSISIRVKPKTALVLRPLESVRGRLMKA